MQQEKERVYRQFFADFESSLNARARQHLDRVLEEEVRRELLMTNWENNISSSHPLLKQTTVEERIKEEVERRLN